MMNHWRNWTAFAALMLFVAADAAGSEDKMHPKAGDVIRQAIGAGRWFPSDRSLLRAMVDGYIEDARVDKVDGRIVSAIAPHAGYLYSGKVAGHTFRSIKENVMDGYRPETVVVLGFSHRGGFRGVALMDGDKIKTPLGESELDDEAAAILSSGSSQVFSSYGPHRGEHSAENLVPFVQAVLPETKIVIGLIGDHDSRTLKDLTSALATLARGREILVLASSDMLHDPDYHRVTRTDKKTLERVAAMDYSSLRKDWSPTRQVFCGIGPVLAVMQFAEIQGCRKGTVQYYRNSGDDFPESRGSWVVGYPSVVFAAGK